MISLTRSVTRSVTLHATMTLSSRSSLPRVLPYIADLLGEHGWDEDVLDPMGEEDDEDAPASKRVRRT